MYTNTSAYICMYSCLHVCIYAIVCNFWVHLIKAPAPSANRVQLWNISVVGVVVVIVVIVVKLLNEVDTYFLISLVP